MDVTRLDYLPNDGVIKRGESSRNTHPTPARYNLHALLEQDYVQQISLSYKSYYLPARNPPEIFCRAADAVILKILTMCN